MAAAGAGDRARAGARRCDVSGCSLSYKLDSFFGQGRRSRTDRFGPPAPAPAPAAAPIAAASPSEHDLAYAKAAAARGARARRKGREPAVGEPRHRRARNGHADRGCLHAGRLQCRDFLASYIRDGAESWLQGDACRIHQGKWTVRKLRPLKRSQPLVPTTGSVMRRSAPFGRVAQRPHSPHIEGQ